MQFLNSIFSLNLILLAADHLVTGTMALFFPKFAVKSYAELFGAEIPATREYFMILKPWGALGIFAGIVGLLPVYDSRRYIGILFALAVLLILRLIYRLKFQKDSEQFLKLTKKRNLRHVALIVVCAVVIILQISNALL